MDWGAAFCRIARATGWTFEQIGALTWKQFQAMLRDISEEPWQYVVMVEPKRK